MRFGMGRKKILCSEPPLEREGMSFKGANQLQKGIYEKVIDRLMHSLISELDPTQIRVDQMKLDEAESAKILSQYVAQVVGTVLNRQKSIDQRIVTVNDLLRQLARFTDEPDLIQAEVHESAQVLLALLDRQDKAGAITGRKQDLPRPASSLAHSSLFTGARHEPNMISELKKEILSADRVDILVSFIKWSGLRLMFDELQEFTNSGRPLRVITTSYMGATDPKAIDALMTLANTEVRVSYDTKHTRLHAKAYLFHRGSGYSTAYIGSSNLSLAALSLGLEWNVKVAAQDLTETFAKMVGTFEGYWYDDAFSLYGVKDRPKLLAALNAERSEHYGTTVMVPFDLKPYGFQQEILAKLDAEREVLGHYRNLVVAATGTGKTVMAAFDYKRFLQQKTKRYRLLFVAHREEILQQSLATFRTVLKDQNFGDLFVGRYEPQKMEYLFVSIQTLNSRDLTKYLDADYYDFIVIDEFHHAAAPSYARLLSHFQPQVLLGLTATPERHDGEDITRYFDYRIAASIRLADAINLELLAPFHYFGVSDEVDLEKLRFSRGGYDLEQLSGVYTGNRRRADLIIRSLKKYVTDLEQVVGLGFCVSVAHAQFMANVMSEAGLPSLALHAKSPPDVRGQAKWDLAHGRLRFIFVVDLYNEGVDIPEVNTILFLRPTESLTVFLQQLGRGLRKTDKKECLTVLDFIGRAHMRYRFEDKFRALFDGAHKSVAHEMENGFLHVPRGSFIQLERYAQTFVLENIRKSLDTKVGLNQRMATFFEDTGKELTLTNFARHYQLSMMDFYRVVSKNSFARLRTWITKEPNWEEPNEKVISSSLFRLASLNSRRLLTYLIAYCQEEKEKDPSDELERRFLRMFHYTIWQKPLPTFGFASLLESLEQIRKNQRLSAEMLEIFRFNLAQLDFVDEPVELGFPNPLDLHCVYSRDQVLSALDYFTEERQPSMREGVLHVKERQLDVFFVTLNKSEKEYSPTTMYQDYAVSESLFHWQSQSTTSPESETGQRYIHHRERGQRILLFVRAMKNNAGLARPYTFLGTAQYVKHEGSRPMSILWHLDHPMPEALRREANSLVLG